MNSSSALFLVVFAAVLSFVSCESSEQNAVDIEVLQFALTMENLEAAFYNKFQAIYDESAFVAAGFPAYVYDYLNVVHSQENAHVQLLATALGTNVVFPCEYDFTSVTSVESYLALASMFESDVVSGLDGAISAITNPTYQALVFDIAAEDAGHSAFLLNVFNLYPFPSVSDIPVGATVIESVNPYILHCDSSIIPPAVVRPGGISITQICPLQDPTCCPANTPCLIFGSISIVLTPYSPMSSLTYPPTYTPSQQRNDISALNFALTLENLEATFYNTYVPLFSSAAFVAAGLNATDHTYFSIIQAHENAHVNALNLTILSRTGRGGVAPCPAYNFGNVTTVAQFVAVARALENTGVRAYVGAGDTITDYGLQVIAATIATVEARHASYLNGLFNFSLPLLTNLDNATLPPTILPVVESFISGACTQVTSLVLPIVIGITSVAGDPSFVGFKGEHYQVHGIAGKVFNLITAKTFQMNALFDLLEVGQTMTSAEMKQARALNVAQRINAKKIGSATIPAALPNTAAWSHNGTYLTEIGIKLGEHQIQLIAGEYAAGLTAIVDGLIITPLTTPMPIVFAAETSLTLSSQHTIDINHPLLSISIANSDRFFNIDRASLSLTTDVDKIDGLLGQSVHESFKVENNAEYRYHMVYDYLVRSQSLFDDDFVENKFASAKL